MEEALVRHKEQSSVHVRRQRGAPPPPPPPPPLQTSHVHALPVLLMMTSFPVTWFPPPGCSGAGEPAAAGLLPQGGEIGRGAETAVQALPQKHALLHLQGRRYTDRPEVCWEM